MPLSIETFPDPSGSRLIRIFVSFVSRAISTFLIDSPPVHPSAVSYRYTGPSRVLPRTPRPHGARQHRIAPKLLPQLRRESSRDRSGAVRVQTEHPAAVLRRPRWC